MGSCPKIVTSCYLAIVCFSFEESLYLWLNMHPRKSWTACFTPGPLVFLRHLVKGMSISGLWTAEPCLPAAAPWAVVVGGRSCSQGGQVGGPLDQHGHMTFLWKGRQRASWVLPRGRVRVLGARGGGGKQVVCGPGAHPSNTGCPRIPLCCTCGDEPWLRTPRVCGAGIPHAPGNAGAQVCTCPRVQSGWCCGSQCCPQVSLWDSFFRCPVGTKN